MSELGIQAFSLIFFNCVVRPLFCMHCITVCSCLIFVFADLWSVISAPLIISNNLLDASAYNLETYGNEEVIAVDQDPLGIPGASPGHMCFNVSRLCYSMRRLRLFH